jgi:hypothetical protein
MPILRASSVTLIGWPADSWASTLRCLAVSRWCRKSSCSGAGISSWAQRRKDASSSGIGDTERTRSASFLFNHFTADDTAVAVRVWEELAGWYTAKVGVDNSTLLQPTSQAPYALVNYVRLPNGAARFLLAQLCRPSFHTYVRRRLRDDGMVALPILCKSA